MKLSILTENRAEKRGLLAEHGLSLLIEEGNTRWLFDTGQTDVFLKNAPKINADLSALDGIILSHGHYDHCGGLTYFQKKGNFPKIYINQGAFIKRYAKNPDGKSYREIGIPWSPEDYPHIQKNIIFCGQRTKIAPHITLLSEIPHTTDFEGHPQGFCMSDQMGNLKSDWIADEQMMIIEREEGLFVFLGCSHAGIVNCLTYAMDSFDGKPIHFLAAGMHMRGIGQERLHETIAFLKALRIPVIIPFHCTGIESICEMKKELGSSCLPLCTGDTLTI